MTDHLVIIIALRVRIVDRCKVDGYKERMQPYFDGCIEGLGGIYTADSPY